jgi:hypothetical protein
METAEQEAQAWVCLGALLYLEVVAFLYVRHRRGENDVKEEGGSRVQKPAPGRAKLATGHLTFRGGAWGGRPRLSFNYRVLKYGGLLSTNLMRGGPGPDGLFVREGTM